MLSRAFAPSIHPVVLSEAKLRRLRGVPGSPDDAFFVGWGGAARAEIPSEVEGALDLCTRLQRTSLRPAVPTAALLSAEFPRPHLRDLSKLKLRPDPADSPLVNLFRLLFPWPPRVLPEPVTVTPTTSKLAALWRAFSRRDDPPPRSDPLRSEIPDLRDAEIAAVYYDHRMAGDFYEFIRAGKSSLLFARQDFNEAIAMMNLCYAMNRTILEHGVRTCPAFIGCYNEDLGTVCYANAGHTSALLRHNTGITQLEATGLPLGLFSHVTQGAATCALEPGSALLAVSRGIVEAEAAGEEFGLDRVMGAFQRAAGQSAHALCIDVLQAIQDFTHTPPTHNDVTALVLTRRISGKNL